MKKIADFYSTAYDVPETDQVQDWTLDASKTKKSGDSVEIHFSRPIDTKDGRKVSVREKVSVSRSERRRDPFLRWAIFLTDAEARESISENRCRVKMSRRARDLDRIKLRSGLVLIKPTSIKDR